MIKIKKNIILIVLGIIILLGIIIYFQYNTIIKLKNNVQETENLYIALFDSINYYKNKNNELVAEKLTIQTTYNILKNNYDNLNNTQKELLDRILELDKKNKIITAALIKSEIKIDSLLIIMGANNIAINIDTINNKINFNNLQTNDSTFIFDIDVNNIYSMKNKKPELLFKSIIIPNKQFIEFHWNNDKKKGYPVSFSVINTNKYFKVYDIESYAIPQLDKSDLSPNGWQKLGLFIKKNGKSMFLIGLGAAGGIGGYYLLTK